MRNPLFQPAPADVVALSSTCKNARQALSAVVFRCVMLGGVIPQRKERLVWLREKGGKVLEHVRVVALLNLKPEAFEAANDCLKAMLHLEGMHHDAANPIAPLFVKTLKTLPHFHAFCSPDAGVEDLPHLLPLARQLDSLDIDTQISAPSFVDCWDLCPITVAPARRNKLRRDLPNFASLLEQAHATVDGLARLLFAARDNMKHVSVMAHDVYGAELPKGVQVPYGRDWLRHLFERLRQLNGGREYPVFPQLEALRLSYSNIRGCQGFTHLLRTSTKLKELEIAEHERTAMPVLDVAPKQLEWLYVFPADWTSVSGFIRQVISKAPLRSLVVYGMKQHEVSEIFGRRLDNLRYLRICCFGTGAFHLSYLQLIAKQCPNLQHLDITGQRWLCEATDIFEAIRALSHLRFFHHDHPHERPRASPFPTPDGRTIRTNRNGDFRIISVVPPARTINEEMEKRIREDVEAATPLYHKRFFKIAKAHPSLRTIEWCATDELTWTWTFERDGDLDEGKLKAMKHKPEIEIEAGDVEPDEPGIFFRGPL